MCTKLFSQHCICRSLFTLNSKPRRHLICLSSCSPCIVAAPVVGRKTNCILTSTAIFTAVIRITPHCLINRKKQKHCHEIVKTWIQTNLTCNKTLTKSYQYEIFNDFLIVLNQEVTMDIERDIKDLPVGRSISAVSVFKDIGPDQHLQVWGEEARD